MNLANKIYVVGYWASVAYVTDDKDEAEAEMIARRQKHPELPWGVRTVEEAVAHAYRQGMEDS
jgi:hypothetical protein